MKKYIISEDIIKLVHKHASREKAFVMSGFFKTGIGEYAEGDIFIGVTMKNLHEIAKNNIDIELIEIEKLIKHPIHEYRMTALLLLLNKYKKGEASEKKKIFDIYLKNTKHINNWDLVDVSAPKILGDYLLGKSLENKAGEEMKNKTLNKLALSKNLWERRIAIVSSLAFIRNKHFKETLILVEMLLGDRHDLIHKASGWMLRELGKRDMDTLRSFLKKNHNNMPRTTLRYAIERMDEKERKTWLTK